MSQEVVPDLGRKSGCGTCKMYDVSQPVSSLVKGTRLPSFSAIVRIFIRSYIMAIFSNIF